MISKAAGIPRPATGFIEDRDRNLYESSGFQVYSFFQIFHGLDMRDYGYDPEWTASHFSDKGSDVIGKSLAAFVNASPTSGLEDFRPLGRITAAPTK
jgi:hypothetical protein